MDKKTFTLKLHEACSDDELRPLMMCVHFQNGFAYASDSHLVIKQSLEYHTIINPECLEGKSIHKDNFKAIMGFENAEATPDGVACSDNDGRTAFYEYYNRKDMQPPDFESVLRPLGIKLIDFIGISPKYFEKIEKAMHSPTGIFRLSFQGVDRCILIDVPDIENQWAVLMPAILNDTLKFS